MKGIFCRKAWVIVTGLMLMSLPVAAIALTEGAVSSQPPIAQQLIREGDLAMNLTAALGLGTFDNEAAAESALGAVGILPRNGWVADYPVTPDIYGELVTAVGSAADARRIALGRDEALKRLGDASAGLSLAVGSPGIDQRAEIPVTEAVAYPDPAELENYYAAEGPPVVTYYAPPPDYSYLYSWIPSPFWCASAWFPGFFILNDFHRSFFFGDRHFFVSNHFHDFRTHGVFRIDARDRFHGRNFGHNDHNGFNHRDRSVSSGHHGEGHHAFNGHHAINGSRNDGRQAFRNSGQAFQRSNAAFNRGGRMATMHTSGARMNTSFAHSSMRSMGSSSFSGHRSAGSSFSGGFRGGGSGMHGGGGSSGRGGGRR